jgi:putative transposase
VDHTKSATQLITPCPETSQTQDPSDRLRYSEVIDSMAASGGAAMSDLILLSESQMRRIEPYFPLSHGVPRVDDRRVISGIIFVIRNGLRWPKDYGPHKTIYNRFIRWSRLGVFNRILAELAAGGGKPDQLMIDAFPRRNPCFPTKATTPIGSVTPWRLVVSPPASRQRATGRCRYPMTRHSTGSVIRSRTCSANSRTGAASTRAMTAAHIPSCPPSASRLPLSSGSDQ